METFPPRPEDVSEWKKEKKEMMNRFTSSIIGEYITISYTMKVRIVHSDKPSYEALDSINFPIKIFKKESEPSFLTGEMQEGIVALTGSADWRGNIKPEVLVGFN